jgi:superfamily II DNA or RNA helicase
MLTLQGYKISKTKIDNIHHTKGVLNVRPYIPSVFVKPQFVQRYKVFSETDDSLFIPKHYGIQEFGLFTESTRNVEKTPDKFWEFNGKLREQQIPVVNSFLKPEPHDGIISLQTGGGKTICALYIASQLKLPAIILVHNTFLKDQWVERIKDFLPNARIGSVQGEIIDIENKEFVIAMLQSLALKDYPNDLFSKIGLVIVDECHHIASEAFSRSIPKLTSKYMLGLSATPERKDKLMHVINWFLGPILYKSDSSDKVDENVNVEYYEFIPKDPKFNEIIYNSSGVMFTSLMINKVVESDERNHFLIKILEDVYPESNRQILVLTDRIEHTKVLYELLGDKKESAGILSSKISSEERSKLTSTKRILIATYQMCKEGFDVPSLNTLLMATSRPDIDQIVGRILRVEKDKRKVDPLILDIVDPSFRNQFQARLSLYKKRNYKISKMVI